MAVDVVTDTSIERRAGRFREARSAPHGSGHAASEPEGPRPPSGHRPPAYPDAIPPRERSASKPLSRLGPSMGTARPAAGLTLAFVELRAHSPDVVGPRLRLLDDGRPADPFVTLDGCEVVPASEQAFVGGQRGSHVFRHVVQHASSDSRARGRAAGEVLRSCVVLLARASPPPCGSGRPHDRATLALRVTRSSSSCAKVSCVASAAPVPAASSASFEG
jgi:hypothetical protein